MRFGLVFLAAVVTLVPSSDAASSELTDQSNVVESKSPGNRFLRAHKVTSDNDESEVLEEERGLPGEVVEKASSSIKKLTPVAAALAYDESLEGLARKAMSLHEGNIKLFKQIDEMGVSPYQMREKLGIA